ncbi:MAG: hypothetical protein KF856_00905 [Cyclobacteriaceae bacterium]|nr:hypothetical protein [Cyclobacteriaceae bacterium]
MIRFFSFVLSLILLISSTKVWSSSFTDNLRAEEVESTEERAEGQISSFTASYFSKVRKPLVTPVTRLIFSSNFNSIQVDDCLVHLALNRYQLKNKNKPTHIINQVFLI